MHTVYKEFTVNAMQYSAYKILIIVNNLPKSLRKSKTNSIGPSAAVRFVGNPPAELVVYCL